MQIQLVTLVNINFRSNTIKNFDALKSYFRVVEYFISPQVLRLKVSIQKLWLLDNLIFQTKENTTTMNNSTTEPEQAKMQQVNEQKEQNNTTNLETNKEDTTKPSQKQQVEPGMCQVCDENGCTNVPCLYMC